MNQVKETVNSHIEEYLDYYCRLPHAPGFAILLKGEWGSGKTWFINRFINKYRENHQEESQRCLYISLYGMTSFSEIEDAFFQQLHPILGSKGMAIAGKILKGVAKITLKIDLNDDATLNTPIPDLDLPKYFKNIDKSVLIFDDLERCKIDLSNLLGYINYFVEHQELKVILIANEDELLKNSSYKFIKEKLIGKTFSMSLDFEGALENFITTVNESVVRDFLSDNIELTKNLYEKAEYENLRTLRQNILDFERIFDALPDKAQNKPEVLQDIWKLLTALSIEIRRGAMNPKDIRKLQEEYVSGWSKNTIQSSNLTTESSDEELTSLQKILNRYPFLNPYALVPSSLWWQTFFDKGTIDQQELKQSILNSKYFQDENTPDWVSLWHFHDLSDDQFRKIFRRVESEYNDKKYEDIGVVKHVFGLFLVLSDIGLYQKIKNKILEDSKTYVDYLRSKSKLPDVSPLDLETDSYGSLIYQGKDLDEFKEFSSYVDKIGGLVWQENMVGAGEDLLTIMQSDVRRFSEMVYLRNSHNMDDREYYQIPIFKYINSNTFVEKLLSISSEDQRRVFWALSERYKFDSINEQLIEELEWLRAVQCLLEAEVLNRQGQLSGFILNSMIKRCVNESIKKLEIKEM